jgi:hypothetical protein
LIALKIREAEVERSLDQEIMYEGKKLASKASSPSPDLENYIN